MPKPDYIEELGIVVLPHHLRRVVDLLMEGSDQFYEKLELKCPPRATSTMSLIEMDGPVRVTEVAERLKLAHPYVIRMVSKLISAGLVSERNDPNDSRARLLELTTAGRKEAQELKCLNVIYKKLYEELMTEIGIDIFDGALRIKDALEKSSCLERMLEIENLENKK